VTAPIELLPVEIQRITRRKRHYRALDDVIKEK
jgi:hypothetical protein